jgi:hypothetical protein
MGAPVKVLLSLPQLGRKAKQSRFNSLPLIKSDRLRGFLAFFARGCYSD